MIISHQVKTITHFSLDVCDILTGIQADPHPLRADIVPRSHERHLFCQTCDKMQQR